MKKFSLILLALVLVFAILGATYYIKVYQQPGQEISINDAFNSSGAKMIVNEVYFFSRADDNFKGLGSLTDVCEAVYKALGIESYTRSSNSTDTLIKTDLLGSTSDGITVSAMASIVGDKTDNTDKYITINVTGNDKADATGLRDKIESVFNSYKLKVEVNSCITGTYDGNLSDSQLEGICRKILNDSSAEKVDSMRQQNIISVSAFSPMIKDKLTIDGKNVNLSLAIRYNKLENKTYLWVATPVVNSEY